MGDIRDDRTPPVSDSGTLRSTLERDPGTRLEFLEQACLGDAELLGEVQKLIKTDEQADSLLDGPLDAREVLARLPSLLPMEGAALGRIGLQPD
jgi:hypothetical protein